MVLQPAAGQVLPVERQPQSRAEAAQQDTATDPLKVAFAQLGFPDLPLQPEFHLTPRFPDGRRPDLTIYDVPPDYQLAPGDEVGVYITGEVQKEIRTPVHSDGRLFLAPAGMVRVEGLTLPQAEEAVDRALRRFYDNFSLHFSLIRARTVDVILTGDVVRPGVYHVSGVQPVLNAVLQAGGVRPGGSWRGITSQNNAGQRTTHDLYPGMLDGPESNRSQGFRGSGRVHVPAQQHWVAVTGRVGKPGVYQLPASGTEPLSRLLRWAGGFRDDADTRAVSISRLGENQTRSLLPPIHAPGNGSSPDVRHGDIVHVPGTTLRQTASRVGVRGEVVDPGWYAYADGMRLSDALRLAGGVTRAADMGRASIVRVLPTDADTTVAADLESALAAPGSEHDPRLGPDDLVFVRKTAGWRLDEVVQIRGEVQYPGFYSIERDGTRLSEILALAGGPTSRALLPAARIRRLNPLLPAEMDTSRIRGNPGENLSRREKEARTLENDLRTVSSINVDVAAILAAPGGVADPVLVHRDIVEVPAIPEVVFVAGRVGRPGGVPFRPGANIDWYLEKAGATTWDAARRKIRVIRTDGRIVKPRQVKSLARGDTIWVPRKDDTTTWDRVRGTISLLAQLATIYIVIDRSF